MSYTQLVSPNLAVVGVVGMCEAYTENVFGAPHGHEADAFAGWNDAQFKHPGETPPANLSVPIFFNWVGTIPKIGGITKNWGHACVWNKGTIYTSPLSGTGHLTYSSIAAIQKAFGLGTYLGWAQDISTKRVVEGDVMDQATQNKVDYANQVSAAFAKSVFPAVAGNAGNGPQMALAVADYDGWKQKGIVLEAENIELKKQLAAQGVVLTPGKYQVN